MNNKNQLISKILIFISGTSTKYKFHQDKTSPLKVRFKVANMDVAQKHIRQTRINEDHYLCCKSVSGQRVRYNPKELEGLSVGESQVQPKELEGLSVGEQSITPVL